MTSATDFNSVRVLLKDILPYKIESSVFDCGEVRYGYRGVEAACIDQPEHASSCRRGELRRPEREFTSVLDTGFPRYDGDLRLQRVEANGRELCA